MNTERAQYRPEEDEDDDSNAVVFGQGAAFRPVPRVPRSIERPEPKPKPVERAPRLPEGVVLFQRTVENTPEIDEDNTEDGEHRPRNIQAIIVGPETPPAAKRPDVDRTFVNPIALEAKQEPVIGEGTEQTDEGAAAFRPIVYPELPRMVLPSQRTEHGEDTGADPAAGQQERVIVPPNAPSTADLRREARFYTPGKPEWGDARVSDLETSPPQAAHGAERQSPDASQGEPMQSAEAPLPSIHGVAETEPEAFTEAPLPPIHTTGELPTASAAAGYGESGGTGTVAKASVGPSGGSRTGSASGGGGGGHHGGHHGGHGSGGSGGGGTPPGMPPGSGGGLGSPNANPGGQPSGHNSYSGSGGGAGGGYNPNVASPSVTIHERPQHTTIINKKGSLLPYVAVLAETFARRRADRKLKKELSGRMDDQEQTAADNQLRLEQQQSRAAEEQRRQAIRDAYKPSGNEWGVPQPRRASEAGMASGVAGVAGIAGAAGAPGAAGERPLGFGAVPGQPGQSLNRAPQSGQEQQIVYADGGQAGVQPGQHIERSSWHNVVVDGQGQEVAGATQYGQGFRQEQREIIRDHTGDSAVVGVGAAGAHMQGGSSGRNSGGGSGAGSGGGSAGFGGGYASPYNTTSAGSNVVTSSGSSYQDSSPSGATPPSLPQGLPTNVDVQHRLPQHTKRAAPGPVFWLMIVLIIVAFFVAATL